MSEQSLKDKTVKGVIWSSVERFSVQGIHFIVMLVGKWAEPIQEQLTELLMAVKPLPVQERIILTEEMKASMHKAEQDLADGTCLTEEDFQARFAKWL